jgi:hypothetical protein
MKQDIADLKAKADMLQTKPIAPPVDSADQAPPPSSHS